MRKGNPVRSMISKSIDLSIIITAHNEGLIAHKTVRSILKAAQKLSVLNYSYEIIASIDNGTSETIEYFDSIKSKYSLRILDVSFGDLSTSRNNAIRNAKGEYVTFIDADDLMSENWLEAGLNTAARHPESIIHPEYSITFGDDNLIWKKRNSEDIQSDTLYMIDNNLWDSPCLANRKIFQNHPYYPNGNGFGYEDKKFNSDTLADSISHIVAPQTLLFVRRKAAGSMLKGAIADKATLAPTKLMSYDAIRKIDLSSINVNAKPKNSPLSGSLRMTKHVTKKILLKTHSKAKNYDTYLKIVRPLREMRQEKIQHELRDKYPEWMMDAWKAMHKIDNSIFPSRDLLKGLSWYSAENIIPGYKYTEFVQSLSKKPDTLFFIPHLIKGGADLVFINYANELQAKKGWNIAMLQTEPRLSVWKEKISPEIDFIDIYEILHELDHPTKQRLLATFIAQNNIKRIIIGNSQAAYDFVADHKTLLTRLDIAVYCFAFGEEFDEEGRLWGHIHTGIPKVYSSIHRIITDNQNTVNKLSHEYAFDEEKFRVHYQPTSAAVRPSIQHTNHPLRILWASRVCKQKRPDIIKAVSNKLNDNNFTIDAWGQLEEGLTESYFNDSRVNYKGPFNGIDNLPTSDYDIFIYTSEGDGVPNILQEITAAGLPIIASNVGGIREFVKTNDTGILIEDHEDIDDYVVALEILKDPDIRVRLNKNAQKLLETQFSKNTWASSISIDFDK